MRNALGIWVAVWLGLVFQTSLFPRMLPAFTDWDRLHGTTVDMALLSLMYLSLNRDRKGVICWAVVIGIMAGWFGTAWKAAAAASYFSVALLCSVLSPYLMLESAGPIALFAGAITLFESLIHFQMGKMMGGSSVRIFDQSGTVLVQIAVHALAAPFIYLCFTKWDQWTGRRKPGASTSLVIEL